MFEKVLPRSIDNNYRGNKLGLWLLGVVIVMPFAKHNDHLQRSVDRKGRRRSPARFISCRSRTEHSRDVYIKFALARDLLSARRNRTYKISERNALDVCDLDPELSCCSGPVLFRPPHSHRNAPWTICKSRPVRPDAHRPCAFALESQDARRINLSVPFKEHYLNCRIPRVPLGFTLGFNICRFQRP